MWPERKLGEDHGDIFKYLMRPKQGIVFMQSYPVTQSFFKDRDTELNL